MKKVITILSLLVLSTVVFTACNNQASTDQKGQADTIVKTADTMASKNPTMAPMYTCTMHPEVTSDKPGKCPKCGMDLVKKEIKSNMGKDDMKKMNMDSTKH